MSSTRLSLARSCAALVATSAVGLVMTLTAPAAALTTFPSVIQKKYNSTCAPQCTLCHTRPEGGSSSNFYLKPSPLDDGYVPKMVKERGEEEFFANLISINKGLPTNDSKLEGYLNKLGMAKCTADSNGPCDSDGDGIIDVNEFAKDQDPDVAGGSLCLGPTYGCGATIKPLPRDSHAKRSATSVLALLGLGLVFARRLARR
jgi:hypothetical protein